MNEMIINNEINIEQYRNVFVLSDIHGCKIEFEKMLDKIKFDDEKDLLIILGDMVDRGMYSVELLYKLMNIKNIAIIKGNHEEMLVEAMKSNSYANLRCWHENGGYNTYKSLMNLSESDRIKIITTLERLPLYLKIQLKGKKYLLVHAGLHIFKDMELEEMIKVQGKELLWTRKSFLKSKVEHDFIVIFGHTRTFSIPFEIDNYPNYYNFYSDAYDEMKIMRDIKNSKIWYNENFNKIGIDCGVSSGGKLACLKLNDMCEYYI